MTMTGQDQATLGGVKVGDRVLVEGVVTSMGRHPRVGFRVARRVGSSYTGSSTGHRFYRGVVVHTVEVPAEDVRPV